MDNARRGGVGGGHDVGIGGQHRVGVSGWVIVVGFIVILRRCIHD